MNRSIIASIAIATLTSACATTPQRPATLASLTMADGPAMAAPTGFIEMCDTTPALCGPAVTETPVAPVTQVADVSGAGDPGGDAPLAPIGPLSVLIASVGVPSFAPAADPVARKIADQAMGKLLKTVNRRVNGNVRQRTDAAIFGRMELWRRSGIGRDAQGDCEDLAIEKREQLIAGGMPRELLFYATAYRQDLGLHTVLVARTARGDMVLDSRSPYVQLWRDLPYDWVSRQNPDAPMRWSMIVDRRRAAATQLAASDVANQATSALQ